MARLILNPAVGKSVRGKSEPILWAEGIVECSPKTEPEVMRESGAERRRNSHEKEKI
jgi:hypothetical protein